MNFNPYSLEIKYANTLGKGMNPLLPGALNWIVPILSFKDGFGMK